jgi:gliding motility-associated-like protein
LLEVQVHSEDVLCKGELTGTASVEIQGGTQAYSVLWENDDTNFYTVGLGAGEIWVTVTDANNCVETAYSVITEPATGIEIDLNVQQVTCYGANDGAINSFASGGTPPYLYTWYINGMELSGATIKNLDVGTYILMVYDNNGCSTDTIVQLFQVNSLVADVEVGNTSCIGNYDGYISITAQGGTKPYSYYLMDMLWDSPIIDSLYRGEYYLTVIDSNYCEYNFGPIIVADTDEDCLKIPAAFSPNGDGYNDEFFIENIHLYPRAVIQIFNRWGQLLYEDLGLNGFWDGTYSGNPVPTGAYLYNIILNIDEDPRVGTITLIR